MDRNAHAAAPVDEPSTEPCCAESQVRSLSGCASEAGVQACAVTLDETPEASEQPPAPLAPGTCVAGKYIICDVLGLGGSAVVYAAEQVNLKRVVAFKLYPARGDQASTLLQRFEREAQLLARVHDENVVAVFDAGRMADGSPYLVVQRLHGDSLAARLRADPPLSVAEAVEMAAQMLNALCALGEAGITHRDVKPDNIVLDRAPDGRTVLKLVDFGIAKEAHDPAARELDEMVGTPGYMAPEQVRGEGIDARSDLYALGATLYEALTGRPPHLGDTVQQVAMATLFGAIAPLRELRPDCPEELSQIVMRALARDPAERFASAREMKSALERWRGAGERPASEPVRAQEPPRALEPACASERLHTQEEIEDTLRLPVPSAVRARARARRARARRGGAQQIVAVACLASLATLATFQVKVTPARVTDLALQASELVPLDLALQARDAASGLTEQTSASVAGLLLEARGSAIVASASASISELATRVRASAHELVEVARKAAPIWGGVIGSSARE